MKNAVSLLINKLPKLKRSFEQLSKQDCLVGVPMDENARQDEKTPVNNATLAYIHDNGAPASNIPARPFMKPGIEAVKSRLIEKFKKGAVRIAQDENIIEQTLTQVGLIAQSSIRNTLGAGIPPPLKPSTIANRRRSRQTATMRKGEREYFAAKEAGSTDAEAQEAGGIVPLVNTGQLRNSINFVIRTRK